MDGGPYPPAQEDATMQPMSELVSTARREGTGELLLTSGLLVIYMGLRGTARALGALEHAVTR